MIWTQMGPDKSQTIKKSLIWNFDHRYFRLSNIPSSAVSHEFDAEGLKCFGGNLLLRVRSYSYHYVYSDFKSVSF